MSLPNETPILLTEKGERIRKVQVTDSVILFGVKAIVVISNNYSDLYSYWSCPRRTWHIFRPRVVEYPPSLTMGEWMAIMDITFSTLHGWIKIYFRKEFPFNWNWCPLSPKNGICYSALIQPAITNKMVLNLEGKNCFVCFFFVCFLDHKLLLKGNSTPNVIIHVKCTKKCYPTIHSPLWKRMQNSLISLAPDWSQAGHMAWRNRRASTNGYRAVCKHTPYIYIENIPCMISNFVE